jgi:hypothetical protein
MAEKTERKKAARKPPPPVVGPNTPGSGPEKDALVRALARILTGNARIRKV